MKRVDQGYKLQPWVLYFAWPIVAAYVSHWENVEKIRIVLMVIALCLFVIVGREPLLTIIGLPTLWILGISVMMKYFQFSSGKLLLLWTAKLLVGAVAGVVLGFISWFIF